MIKLNLIHPQPPPVFIGREEELKKLKDATFQFNILFIVGLPGIGKTSLAARLSNELAEMEKKESIWINCLEGWDVNSISLQIIEALKVIFPEEKKLFDEYYSTKPLVKPRDETEFDEADNKRKKERILYLTSIINDRNVTVFIDNFEKISKPASKILLNTLKLYLRGTRFIFVSREQPLIDPLKLMDIYLINLGFLSTDKCRKLVMQILSSANYKLSNPDLMESLCKSTGGHPFLVKKAISILLSKGSSLDHSFPCKITASYLESELLNHFQSTNRQLLYIFAIARKPLLISDLEEISGINNIEQIVLDLKYKLIIDQNLQEGFYIHDLLKEAILKSLMESDKKKLHRKTGGYFAIKKDIDKFTRIENLKEAFWHFIQGKSPKEAKEVFHQLYPIMERQFLYDELKAMFRMVLDKTPSPDESLSLAGANIFRLVGDLTMSRKILENLPQSKNLRNRIEKFKLLSLVYHDRGDLEESLKMANKALRLVKRIDDRKLRIQFLLIQADIYLDLCNNRKARNSLKKCLKLIDRKEDKFSLANVLQTMGIIYYRERKLDKSAATMKEAISYLDPEKDTLMIATLNGELGIIYQIMGNFSLSIEHFDKTMSFGARSGDAVCKAASLCNLGVSYYLMGRRKKGIDLLQKGLKLYKNWGYRKKLVLSVIHLAVLYLAENKISKAENILLETLYITERMPAKRLEVAIRLNLIEIYLYKKDIRHSKIHINKTEKLLKRLKQFEASDAKYLFHLLKAELLFRENKTEKFLETAKQVNNNEQKILEVNKYLGDYFLYITGAYKKLNIDTTEEILVSKINSLSEYDKLLIDFSFERLKKLGIEEKKYLVISNERRFETDSDGVSATRKEKEKYDLWLDTVKGEYFQKEKGSIDLQNKRLLLPLLVYFIKNKGRFLTASEIYENIWKGDYERKLNYNTLRSSIARLRKEIEPDSSNPQYIKTRRSWNLKETAWIFENTNKFCLISKTKWTF